jgi:hypothetical protein
MGLFGGLWFGHGVSLLRFDGSERDSEVRLGGPRRSWRIA